MTAARRIGSAALLTAITDGLFSSVLAAFFYGSTVARLFQGVAATLLGDAARQSGWHGAGIGIAMHVGVAFGWSVCFLAIAQLPAVRRLIRTPLGVVATAAIYGPCVWLMMSLAVIPLLTGRPPTITFRWWVQFVGHGPFVGLPIVSMIARGAPAGAPRRQ